MKYLRSALATILSILVIFLSFVSFSGDFNSARKVKTSYPAWMSMRRFELTPLKMKTVRTETRKNVTVTTGGGKTESHTIYSRQKEKSVQTESFTPDTGLHVGADDTFPFATRVCTHEERIRHLQAWCRGAGKSMASQYKRDISSKFMSSTVRIKTE